MKHAADLKKVVAFFIGMTILFSCLGTPCLSIDVLAADDKTIADVTDLHWVEGSQATLEWTGVEEADRYLVKVTVYESEISYSICHSLFSENTG